MPWAWQNRANSAEVYWAPLSLWNTAPGWTWPWVMAIARASVTRLVRMWSASCQPVTIRVARSMTVARYSHPSPVLR